MKDDIQKYVTSCSICQMNKHSLRKQVGMLKPLPIPKGPFRIMTTDFITSLSKVHGCDAILVVVDRFLKHARFAPTTFILGAEDTAKLFNDY
jgi:hypothetical protein